MALGFIWMMERALYKNVKRAIPTDEMTYVKAMISNQLWDPAAKKQVSFWKYILFIVILLSVLGVTFVAFYAAIPSIFHSFAMREPFDIQIYGSLLAGLLPGVSYTLIFQNNPFLWFHAINMYDKRKVIFKEEEDV
ncbi:hypothetical protein [Streptococcus loxodontisalivarius]|uniref:Uncharacterized protein n=1 Tax=Streptococcus loxodontisalivarius TaxID=1349415 RepID=A0ABS2PUM3_9STRE|nr:hypothetical protein [Streptococcus loxodontisalivarius]MBM7643752.1 hypothetical protein [Streptococcus loxodontisalivarius]